jgi:hypothetical protein
VVGGFQPLVPVATVAVMEPVRVRALALHTGDRIKVGMERFEPIDGINDQEPGVVRVTVHSGLVLSFNYHELVTIRPDTLAFASQLPVRRRQLRPARQRPGRDHGSAESAAPVCR